jgi:transposase
MNNPLELRNPEQTRKALLKLSKQIPGAAVGIKIAAMLLTVEGQRPGWIADVLGLTRTNVPRWIREVNRKGVDVLKGRTTNNGRPSQLNEQVAQDLEKALEKSPREYGLNRFRWDGPTVVEYLKREFGIKLKARQAGRWMHKLGYRLKRASYVYVQARAEDARKFRCRIKKTQNAGER